jgi:hypothetical protein
MRLVQNRTPLTVAPSVRGGCMEEEVLQRRTTRPLEEHSKGEEAAAQPAWLRLRGLDAAEVSPSHFERSQGPISSGWSQPPPPLDIGAPGVVMRQRGSADSFRGESCCCIQVPAQTFDRGEMNVLRWWSSEAIRESSVYRVYRADNAKKSKARHTRRRRRAVRHRSWRVFERVFEFSSAFLPFSSHLPPSCLRRCCFWGGYYGR